MKALVIGSTAMKHWYPEFREPKDLDVFSNNGLYKSADIFWHPMLDSWIRDTGIDDYYATPNELLTIKLSHISHDLRNNSWNKHMWDIGFLQDHGAVVIEDFYEDLVKIWKERYAKREVDLSLSKQEFFDDSVPKLYDHDSIHLSAAYNDRPMYERFLIDEVKMDMAKVWASSFEDQVMMWMEEISVIALERFLIPANYEYSPMAAWSQSLRKCITSLSKGKSSRFLAENYRIFRKPDRNYVESHLNKSHLLIKLDPSTQGV